MSSLWPVEDGAIEGLSKSVFEAVNVLAHAAPRTSLL